MCEKFGKIFLILINIAFFLAGAGLLVIGLLAIFKEDLLYQITDILTDNLGKVFEDLDSVAHVDFAGLIKTNAIILCVIGGVILIIGGLGMFGACKMSSTLLTVYGVIVLVLLFAEIGFGVYAYMFSDQFEGKIKNGLKLALYGTYENGYRENENITDTFYLSQEAEELGMDLLQVNLKCCGVANYTEWIEALKWDNNYTVTTGIIIAKVPPSCCLLKPSTTSQNDFFTIKADDFEDLTKCMQGDETKINTAGCYKRLRGIITSNQTIILAVFIVILVVQVVAVSCACFLKSKADTKK